MPKADCELAAYISPGKMSWSVLDAIHHRVISVVNHQFPKEENQPVRWQEAAALLSEAVAGERFGSVKIAVDTGSNMLVPKELFAESKISDYLAFSMAEYEFPVHDFIESIPAFNLYALPGSFLESLRKVFEKFDAYHAATPFISNILRENRSSSDSRLFACFTSDILHLCALAGGEFAFYNSYPVHTKEDFCYYLLAVSEELSFHPEEISVLLSGEITPDSPFCQTAKRFLRNLAFAERPKALKYSSRLEAVPRHLHSLLYSIHLCA